MIIIQGGSIGWACIVPFLFSIFFPLDLNEEFISRNFPTREVHNFFPLGLEREGDGRRETGESREDENRKRQGFFF